MARGGAPAMFRDIHRRVQGTAATDRLVSDAEQIRDPSWRAAALLEVAAVRTSDLGDERAMELLRNALEALDDVAMHWRRAEVLVQLLDALLAIRHRLVTDALVERIYAAVSVLDEGEPRSKAIQDAAAIDGADHERLFALAQANGAEARADQKAVVRAWIATDPTPATVARIMKAIRALPRGAETSRLLGYVALQAERRDITGAEDAYSEAIESAVAEPDEQARVETLRHHAGQVRDVGRLGRIRETVTDLPVAAGARVLATVAAAADRLGATESCRAWFREAADTAARIDAAVVRGRVRANIVQGMTRARMDDDAASLLEAAQADAAVAQGSEPAQAAKIDSRLDAAIADAPGKDRARDEPEALDTTLRPRHALALYDAYEGGLKRTHFRAVARAAPLCDAFGFDLVLLGFPTEDLDAFVDRVRRETNIGAGGRHVVALHRAGRVHIVTSVRELPGDVVATTSRPFDDRRVSQLASVVSGGADSRPVTVLIGLGRQGLPHQILDEVGLHYEITGERVSLETATAMGILAERLAQLPGPGRSA